MEGWQFKPVEKKEAWVKENLHAECNGNKMQWKHEGKKSKIERKHKPALFAQDRLVALLMELFQCIKSKCKMKNLIELFDKVS